MAAGSYRIEALSPENFSDFCRLRAIVDGRPIDEAFFRAKYATQRFGHAPVGFLAYADDNTPAAYYGVFPLRLRVNGIIIDGAQSGDTMTHPAHRRKGLFVQLAELTYAACREKNIRLVYGLPNPEAQPGFAKLGWRTTAVWQNITLPVHPSFSARLRRKFFPGNFARHQHRMLEALRIDPRTVQQAQLPGLCAVERDIDWFAYKLSLGNHLIGLRHGKALVKVSPWGWKLGDVFDVEQHAAFWEELLALAAATGAHGISFQSDPELSEQYRFPPPAQRSESLPVILLDTGLNESITNIHITAADADTF